MKHFPEPIVGALYTLYILFLLSIMAVLFCGITVADFILLKGQKSNGK